MILKTNKTLKCLYIVMLIINLCIINISKADSFDDYLKDTKIKNWKDFLFLQRTTSEIIGYGTNLEITEWKKIIGTSGYVVAHERMNNLRTIEEAIPLLSKFKSTVPTYIYRWNMEYEYNKKYNYYFWYLSKYIELDGNHPGITGDTSLLTNRFNSVGFIRSKHPELNISPEYIIVDTSKHFYSPLLGREYRFFLVYDVFEKDLTRRLEFINKDNIKIKANLEDYKDLMIYKGDSNLGFYLWYRNFGENCYFSDKTSSIVCYNEKRIPDYHRFVFVEKGSKKDNYFYKDGYNAHTIWNGNLSKKEKLEEYFYNQMKGKNKIIILIPYEKVKKFTKFINNAYEKNIKLFDTSSLKNGYIWLVSKPREEDDYDKHNEEKYDVKNNEILNQQIKELSHNKIKVKYGQFLFDNITILDLETNKKYIEYFD